MALPVPMLNLPTLCQPDRQRDLVVAVGLENSEAVSQPALPGGLPA
jgi:hypothetical protein